MNKRGSSNGGCGTIGTVIIVAVVILFRIARELGPEYLTPSGIGKYLGEMAIVFVTYLVVRYVGNDERIKAPYSTILIIGLIVVAIFAIGIVWRL